MKWIVLALIAVAALVAAGFMRLPSARRLDLADRAWPGSSPAVKVAEAVTFGTDARQQLDVWQPTGASKTLRPVIVWFYGGGWNSGARGDYGFAARAFAESGYIVVVPDYRLVPDVSYPAFLEDAAAAVRWTRDEIAGYGGDPDRIALAGHSAGAYNAMMLALDKRWLSTAGVDPAVVKAVVGLAGPYDFFPFTTDSARAAFGAALDPAATQPITYARADAPPMFLASGTADTIVKPRNGRALAAKLRALGAQPVVAEYAGLGHYDIIMAVGRPFRGKAPVLADSDAFLKDALGKR